MQEKVNSSLKQIQYFSLNLDHLEFSETLVHKIEFCQNRFRWVVDEFVLYKEGTCSVSTVHV